MTDGLTAAVAVEYLYELELCSIRRCPECPHVSARHRILRRTPKKVLVERLGGAWRKPWVVDRARLERQGGIHVVGEKHAHGWALYLYASPTPPKVEGSLPIRRRPSCTRILGLTRWPSTAEQIGTAYRRLAKTAHPDRGGDAAAFRRLFTAYEQALRFVGARKRTA